MTASGKNLEEIIKNGIECVVQGLGRELVPEVVGVLAAVDTGLFVRYLEMILRWNRRVDLVGPCGFEELVEKHLLDSVAAWAVVRSEVVFGDEGAFLDVGSGAGFPGVIFAVLEPKRRVYLCEAREKRALFLKEVKRELALEKVEVIHSRVEDILEISVSQLELILARAVGVEASFLKESFRLLAPSGYVAELVGPTWKEPNPLGKFSRRIDYSVAPAGLSRSIALWRNS